ncbi:MarR family transcriptional regulator [Actinoplanes sp. NEAU-A12]|uniref:MarR family transcriptional regulator n=1 Tax=Actinoplanes sandaracinus TaxID=3045177 RepID=A0ABT6WVT1_9ACTN|nr:MarR family transcriptional regulator [Actinoplanes sandaracinus]MDI6103856.1 MarR family transcriptional regulator [Actinoplanes sandaracinus]
MRQLSQNLSWKATMVAGHFLGSCAARSSARELDQLSLGVQPSCTDWETSSLVHVVTMQCAAPVDYALHLERHCHRRPTHADERMASAWIRLTYLRILQVADHGVEVGDRLFVLSLVEAGCGELADVLDLGRQALEKVAAGVGEGESAVIVVNESLLRERIDVLLDSLTDHLVEEWRQGVSECRRGAAAVGESVQHLPLPAADAALAEGAVEPLLDQAVELAQGVADRGLTTPAFSCIHTTVVAEFQLYSYNCCNVVHVTAGERGPDELIAMALVRIRRDQQARRLQRRAAPGDPGAASANNAARYRYLDALDDSRTAMSISEIADAIAVDRPRASRLTTELIGKGYIEREPAPGDSRYTLIRLTALGKEFVADIHEHRRRGVAEALAGFTAEESRTLAELLERFVDAWPRNPSAT